MERGRGIGKRRGAEKAGEPVRKAINRTVATRLAKQVVEMLGKDEAERN